MDLDGDGEFEHNLLTQTPNDGQQNIIAPNIASDRARIQMLCSNNIFYTVSTETIEILFTAPVAPIIEGQNVVTIDEDSSIVVTLSDLLIFDPDSAFPEDFSLLLQEAINFTVDGQTISPSANFNGDLRVPMQVNDGVLDSNQFSLLVQVTAINDPPIAVDDMQILTENSGTISINVLANDTDIDSEELFITALDYSGQGQLVINNQQIDYRPAASFVGNESFTYTVSDNELSAQAQVTLQVQGVNPVPTTNRSQNSGGGSIFTLLYLYFAVFSARLVCSKRWGSYE
jgi:hypothetical protein